MVFDLGARYPSLPVMQPAPQKIQAPRPFFVADLTRDRFLVAGLATEPIFELQRFAKTETEPRVQIPQKVG